MIEFITRCKGVKVLGGTLAAFISIFGVTGTYFSENGDQKHLLPALLAGGKLPVFGVTMRALSSLRGLRGAPAVPPLCRETQSLGQRMLERWA